MITETAYIPTLRMPDESQLAQRLLSIEGVLRAAVDSRTRRITVTYDPPATPEAIRSLLLELGFPVVDGLGPLPRSS